MVRAYPDAGGRLMAIWCLSFSGPDGFEGGCFVEVDAGGMEAACQRAKALGIERGDDTLGVRLTPEDAERVRQHIDRLLTLAELEAASCEPFDLVNVYVEEPGSMVR